MYNLIVAALQTATKRTPLPLPMAMTQVASGLKRKSPTLQYRHLHTVTIPCGHIALFALPLFGQKYRSQE